MSTPTRFDFSKPETWTLADCQAIQLQLVAERQQLSEHAMKLKGASEQLVQRVDSFLAEKDSFGTEKEKLLNEVCTLQTKCDGLLVKNQALERENDTLRRECLQQQQKQEQQQQEVTRTKEPQCPRSHSLGQVSTIGALHRCDGCTCLLRSTLHWRCTGGCDFDYCQGCYDKKVLIESKSETTTTTSTIVDGNLPRCPHSHSLKKTTTYGGHRCDTCLCSLPPTVQHWRCASGCDWDSCQGCYDRKLTRNGSETTTTAPQRKKLCPHNHELQSNIPLQSDFPPGAGFIICDGCRKGVAFNRTVVHSCRQCNFDLCLSCASR